MVDHVDEKDRGGWWVFGLGGAGAVALLVAYVRLRNGFAVGTLEAHAQLGDALGPVVAFLTLFAVVAALWSVQIQRTELALQRQELRETREEMVEQRKQFERTAQAQERLAASQQTLAAAQIKANEIALFQAQRLLPAEHAQRMSNIATLTAALASMMSAIEASRDPISRESKREESLQDEMKVLTQYRRSELNFAMGLERSMGDLEDASDEHKG